METLRPLPDGKMYHVFFSYRGIEKDKEWVRNVIKILETQYNFICCDHDVDFLPGRSISKNIKECIKKSVKTVIVLSKEFNESYYCQFELEFTVRMQMSQRQQILIPVEKEFCNIPESLELFTRIDARGEIESWIHRLVSAIEAPVDEINITQPLLTGHNYSNFDTIHKEATKTSCRGEAFQIEHLCNALRRQRIYLNPELLHLLSSTLLVSLRLVINPSWPFCVVCYFLLPSLLINGIILATSKVEIPFGLLLLLLFTLFGIVWPMCCFITNKKGKKDIRSCLLAVNKDLMPQNVFMTYKISRLKAKVTIYFIHYSCRPCISYLMSKSDEENTGLKHTFIEIDDDVPLLGSNDGSTDVETEVSNLLLKISPEYFLDFISGTLGKSTTRRHCAGEICMCEYWEMKTADRKKRNGSHQINRTVNGHHTDCVVKYLIFNNIW